MPYRVKLSREAKKAGDRLPGHVRQRIRRLIDSLANEPRPEVAKELRDEPGVYRIRLDDWRLIYEVDEESKTVIVIRVQRKTGPETYQDLDRQGD